MHAIATWPFSDRAFPRTTHAQALHIAAHHPGAIEMLVTDIVMPGINGYDVAQRVRATRPEIKVLYITGQIESDLGRQCVADKLGSVLSKPFGPREFLARINELLNQSREADAS